MNLQNKLCFVLLGIIFVIFCNIKAFAIEEDELFNPVTIKNGSVVSLADCISNAFKNSPKIKRQKYNLDIAKSKVGIAKSQYFPVIGANVGFYGERNSDAVEYKGRYGDLPRVGVTINQLVWNFGKSTAYIKMEEFYKIGAEYEFTDSLCKTIFDVKEKYYNVLKTQALVKIAQNHITVSEAFVKDAYKEPDKETAKIVLDMAKSDLITAQNNYKNAKIDLANSMYLDTLVDFSVKATPTFDYIGKMPFEMKVQTFNFKFEDAVEIAYKNSPDLKVLASTKNAMEQSLLYIKRTYFPDLTANVGYGFVNSNYAVNNGLQVGVNLTSNVNLMELKHSIKGANAQIYYADNEINLFKDDLYYEVKRAINEINKYQNRIPFSKANIYKAYKNFGVVEKQYKTNILGYTHYRAAVNDYTDMQKKYVEDVYNYNLALIRLERAMHYHIVDIHHKSDHAVQYHSDELIKHLNNVLNCNEHETKQKRKHK